MRDGILWDGHRMNSPLWTVAAIAFVVLILAAQCHAQRRCDEANGTYLWREGKCIDVREIKP